MPFEFQAKRSNNYPPGKDEVVMHGCWWLRDSRVCYSRGVLASLSRKCLNLDATDEGDQTGEAMGAILWGRADWTKTQAGQGGRTLGQGTRTRGTRENKSRHSG